MPRKKGRGRGRGAPPPPDRAESHSESQRGAHAQYPLPQERTVQRRGGGRGSPQKAEEQFRSTDSSHASRQIPPQQSQHQVAGLHTTDQGEHHHGVPHHHPQAPCSPPPAAEGGVRPKYQPAHERSDTVTTSRPESVFALATTSTGLEGSLEKVSLVGPVPPHIKMASRPERSRCCKYQIPIITNFFLLTCNRKVVYHYDVNIMALDQRKWKEEEAPRPIGKNLCHKIVLQWIVENSLQEFSPVFDGAKNLYTCERLPSQLEGEFEINVTEANRTKRFSLNIQPVVKKKTKNNVIDMSSFMMYTKGKTDVIPQEIRMVFEAILSYRLPDSPQINIRNSFFSTVSRRIPLGDGCEMMWGYSQNIRFTCHGPAIVINTAAAAFYKSGPVLTFMSDILRKDVTRANLVRKDIEKLAKKLKGINIHVTHQKYRRKYCIEGLGGSAREQTFQLDDKNWVTVERYFSDKYKMRLRHPLIPCLKMKSSKSTVYQPPEVCDIVPNQRVKGKLDGKLTAAMIQKTALNPERKLPAIQDNARYAVETTKDMCRSYGLQINLQPVETTARVIGQPSIQYKRRGLSLKENGVWDMRQQHFVSAADADRILLICFADCSEGDLNNCIRSLGRASSEAGLHLGWPKVTYYDGKVSTSQAIENAKRSGASLVIVILSPDDPYHTYEEVKFFADIMCGIPSQCINVQQFTGDKRMDGKKAGNICLKINTKLGGVNHMISEWPMALWRESVIVFGADAIHHVGDKLPSIAAVVGCVDEEVSKYAVCCRAQGNPKAGESQEIILDLSSMVRTILMAYYKRNKALKPKKILFYRDGVSEGQFQQVFDKEIPMIKKACCSLEKDYKPPITFVVVQKRHPVRVFPKNPKDGVGRAGNVPPGTIADKDITDPVLWDFYMCSHEGIQGTSKPTRYVVLFDENRVTSQVMEGVTFYLCHVFARCNRSISIPAPVKYADLLCTRAADYVKVQRFQETGEPAGVLNQINDLMKKVEKVQNSMFFI